VIQPANSSAKQPLVLGPCTLKRPIDVLHGNLFLALDVMDRIRLARLYSSLDGESTTPVGSLVLDGGLEVELMIPVADFNVRRHRWPSSSLVLIILDEAEQVLVPYTCGMDASIFRHIYHGRFLSDFNDHGQICSVQMPAGKGDNHCLAVVRAVLWGAIRRFRTSPLHHGKGQKGRWLRVFFLSFFPCLRHWLLLPPINQRIDASTNSNQTRPAGFQFYPSPPAPRPCVLPNPASATCRQPRSPCSPPTSSFKDCQNER